MTQTSGNGVQLRYLELSLFHSSSSLEESSSLPSKSFSCTQMQKMQQVFYICPCERGARPARAKLGGERKPAAPQRGPQSWPSPPPPHTTGPCTPVRRCGRAPAAQQEARRRNHPGRGRRWNRLSRRNGTKRLEWKKETHWCNPTARFLVAPTRQLL